MHLPPAKCSFIEIGEKSPAQMCLLLVDNGNLVVLKPTETTIQKKL